MSRNTTDFDEEVKNATRWYNVVNNIFWVLMLIGSYVIAGSLSTTTTFNSSSYFASTTTETDTGLFISIFLGLSITYTLLYVVIRVIIKSYGEKVRSNLLNQIMLEKLYDISLK